MAFTLEAAIVIPVTMFITVTILTSSIDLYQKIENDSFIESKSLVYNMENEEIWSCKMNGIAGSQWSKMIAVNPVKIKSFLEFIVDTAVEASRMIPAFDEMEALFFADEKQ
ncbi:MAG: hypothetical protein ACYCYI_09025 [Saccharofermentanales bacterium]